MKRTLAALAPLASLITVQAHAQLAPGKMMLSVQNVNEGDVAVGVPTVRVGDATPGPRPMPLTRECTMHTASERNLQTGGVGEVVLSAEATRFVTDLSAAIEASLPAQPRAASLVPYRHEGNELLGLDLSDSRNNIFAVTFHTGEGASLPEAGQIGAVSAHVGVADMTDALQLARHIVHAVSGTAMAQLL